MKALTVLSLGGLLLAGCATSDTGQASRSSNDTQFEGLKDQPQTAVAGEGSLMPGAYESRAMETGQFTGQERTNAEVGQRPWLPPEADPRELERGEKKEMGTGAGTLGQSGIVPGQPVTTETLLEESEQPR